ncbi:MAG TPA: PAS domain-containing protein [Candidatus Eremiobacteraceae bacterium]|nr:PAS domain-containing protein [Candidatus Eremiobacteraceae bacterium]
MGVRNPDEKFATAFRCSPQPFTLSTIKEDRYIEVNDAFVQRTGWAREEAIGHTTLELGIWETHAERFAKALRHAVELNLLSPVRPMQLVDEIYPPGPVLSSSPMTGATMK